MISRNSNHGNPRRLSAESSIAVLIGLVVTVLVVGTLGGAISQSADAGAAGISIASPRLVILKADRLLHLFDGERLVRSYPIDLGTAPVGSKRRQLDGRTPVGIFHIVTKNPASQYHRFLGVDYPDLDALERGLIDGLISVGEAVSIREALAAGRCPEWNTALGGGIGIHGHRIGQDWTGGCIALSDKDVEELYSVLRIGDPVEILP